MFEKLLGVKTSSVQKSRFEIFDVESEIFVFHIIIKVCKLDDYILEDPFFESKNVIFVNTTLFFLKKVYNKMTNGRFFIKPNLP